MSKSRLEELLKVHHKDAFLWACHCCHQDQEDGKEVLQITYVKILEKKAKYHKQSTFKTWLYAVIRYTAIDFVKKKQSYVALESVKISQEEVPSDDDINYEKLLERLPERQYQVLLLAFYHEMTLAEIAVVTELHIGTVRTHYNRGKDAMRRLIIKSTI